MTGAAVMTGDDASNSQGLLATTGKRTADSLLSTATNVNMADEALYRHYPPVNPSCNNDNNKTNSNSSGDGGGESSTTILDTTNTSTFETLNRKLASRWCPPPTPPSSLSSSSCPTTTTKKACLADTSSADNTTNTNTTTANANNPRNLPAAGAVSGTVPPSPQPLVHDGGAGCNRPSSSCGASTSKPCSSSTSSQLLFLVRHGETDMNKVGKLQGRGVNAHLNDAGMEQAQGLGHFVRNVPFDTVTSSSLIRAHQTAMRVAENNDACVKRAQENGPPAPPSSSTAAADKASTSKEEQEEDKPTTADFCCGDKAQVRVRKMEGLDELSWGELEGQDYKLEPFKERLASLKQAWDDGTFDRAAKDGENLIEVEARSRAAVDAILDRGKELNLIVSHGRTLRILMLSMTGLGLDQMTNMGKIPNCGTYVVEVTQSGPGGTRSYRLLPSCP